MKKILVRLYLIIAFLFMYMPIAVLIGLSFNASRSRSIWGGFTLEWYFELFRDSTLMTALIPYLHQYDE